MMALRGRGLLAALPLAAWSFSLEAELSGWRIEAEDQELRVTRLATGVRWRSSLIVATPASGGSWDDGGCWYHEIKPVKDKHWVPSSTVMSGTLDASGFYLQGVATLPKNDSTTWNMTFAPTFDGGLHFRIQVDYEGANEMPLPSHERYYGDKYTYKALLVDLVWDLEDGERVVGGGEQFSTVDLSGQEFEIWSGEQGIGRGRMPITQGLDMFAPYCGGTKYTTYSAVPALLSTRGYGIVLDNTQLVRVNLKDAPARIGAVFEDHLDASSVELAGTLLGASEANATGVRSLIKPLTEITGRMEPPPAWILEGLVIGAEGGYETVDNYVNQLVSAGVKVTGVWIQDWSGVSVDKNGHFVWWNWVLDEKRYPKSWFRKLQAQGIKVLTYVNPFLTTAANADGRVASVFQEAEEKGYLLKDTNNKSIIQPVAFANFTFGMVDLYREEVRNWWIDHLRCHIMMACNESEPQLVHAWMNDYGEYVPFAAQMPDGRLGGDAHNEFPYWSEVAARSASEGYENTSFFARSGSARSPGAARMFWVGDQLTSYDGCDGLQSAVIGTMSGGLSGWTVTHSDIGGFTAIDRASYLPIVGKGVTFLRGWELMVRWLEVAVFINSMYRSHPSLLPELCAQVWTENISEYVRNLTQLYSDMRPYREALLQEAATVGLPPVRHGILVYPEDPTWWNHSDQWREIECSAGRELGLQQFFFGDEVLVAPALDDGVSELSLYVPEGNWSHFWSDLVVQGPKYLTVPAPLGQPVALYRQGARWTDFFNQLSRKWRQAEAKTVFI